MKKHSSKNITAAKFTNYINKVIANARIDYFRRLKHLQNHEVLVDELPEINYTDHDLDEKVTPESIESIATDQAVFLALKSLTPIQQAVLYHVIVECREIAATARLLDKSISRIYAIKKSALKELNQILEKEAPNDK